MTLVSYVGVGTAEACAGNLLNRGCLGPPGPDAPSAGKSCTGGSIPCSAPGMQVANAGSKLVRKGGGAMIGE